MRSGKLILLVTVAGLLAGAPDAHASWLGNKVKAIRAAREKKKLAKQQADAKKQLEEQDRLEKQARGKVIPQVVRTSTSTGQSNRSNKMTELNQQQMLTLADKLRGGRGNVGGSTMRQMILRYGVDGAHTNAPTFGFRNMNNLPVFGGGASTDGGGSKLFSFSRI